MNGEVCPIHTLIYDSSVVHPTKSAPIVHCHMTYKAHSL